MTNLVKNSVETLNDAFRKYDIHVGKATIAYGINRDFKVYGWFKPGGGFTSRREVATKWAEAVARSMRVAA